MDHETEQARDLYIYFGLDSIFCLNLNQLLSSKVKVPLKRIFTLSKHLSPSSLEGIFVMDSKLHCLCGLSKKLISFNLPSFSPDHSITHFESYNMNSSRPILFTTTSQKVYALERDHESFFSVFDPDSGKWKSLPPPPQASSCSTLIEFHNTILLQTPSQNFIFDANENFIFDANEEIWKPINKFFPRILAALEYQDFIFVISVKPFEIVVYDSASFGEKDCFFRVLDIWKGFTNFERIDICWASLSLIGNNLMCLVFVSMYKVHIAVIRFMKKFIFAKLEAYQEHDLPRSMTSSDIPFCSTVLWGLGINQHEKDEIPTVSQQLHIKADQIEENSMDHNQDRYLYIYLGGFGALLSLNFNQLCKNNNSSLDPNFDLQLVFSHHNKGTEFPIGMGLFILDSKLHFFGGENLEESDVIIDYQDYRFSDFSSFVGLKATVRPKYGADWYKRAFNFSEEYSLNFFELNKNKYELCDEWFNKKVYSFDLPYFTSYKTPLPDHSGCKFRPLVFTISDKVYALSTKTISVRVSDFDQVDDDKLKLFEVFEPEKNKWRHLKKLHSELCKEILDNTLIFESHCVFGDKMLLQTETRHYVFDSVKEDWVEDEMCYPRFYSALEYNEEIILVLSKHPVRLLVYESASFGEKDPTFGKLDINKDELYLSQHNIFWASLNLVNHNHISLVLITDMNILVYVFKIEAPFMCAAVVARGVFDVPRNCFYDINPLSTFFMCSDVTKAAGPSEENLAVSQWNAWRLFKEHLYKEVGNSDLANYCPSWSESSIDTEKPEEEECELA